MGGKSDKMHMAGKMASVAAHRYHAARGVPSSITHTHCPHQTGRKDIKHATHHQNRNRRHVVAGNGR